MFQSDVLIHGVLSMLIQWCFKYLKKKCIKIQGVMLNYDSIYGVLTYGIKNIYWNSGVKHHACRCKTPYENM